jgi:hypothetical protein
MGNTSRLNKAYGININITINNGNICEREPSTTSHKTRRISNQRTAVVDNTTGLVP